MDINVSVPMEFRRLVGGTEVYKAEIGYLENGNLYKYVRMKEEAKEAREEELGRGGFGTSGTRARAASTNTGRKSYTAEQWFPGDWS